MAEFGRNWVNYFEGYSGIVYLLLTILSENHFFADLIMTSRFLSLRPFSPGMLVSLGCAIALVVEGVGSLSVLWSKQAIAQPAANQADSVGRAMTLRSDVQEANSKTGVVTARGNVQINYPARQIQATSAQAQYFSKERRIVLSGDVYVLQEGNSMRAETVTYLIDEGRFVALPMSPKQVESIYLVPENNPAAPTPSPSPSPSLFSPMPEFSAPSNESPSIPAAP